MLKQKIKQIKNYFKIDKSSDFLVPQKTPSLDEQLLMLHSKSINNFILVTGISSDDFFEALDFLENGLKNMPIDNTPFLHFRDAVTIQLFLNSVVYSGVEALVKILELRKKSKDVQTEN